MRNWKIQGFFKTQSMREQKKRNQEQIITRLDKLEMIRW